MRGVTGFRVTNAVIVLVVLVAAGIAAWQLARVTSAAQSISAKAANISQSGRGINIATDSVIQLDRTNRTAKSILRSARPLQPKLDKVVGEAGAINGVAGSINNSAGSINNTAGAINGSAVQINNTAGAINSSAGNINLSAGAINGTAGNILGTAGAINGTAGAINGTAGAINGTAGTINGTARGIDSDAGVILREARQIDRDVFLINFFLNGSIDVAAKIKNDTGNIVRLARNAESSAACIDRRVGGREDGDCNRGNPGDGADTDPSDGSARLGRRGGPGPNPGG
jgi:methyl-accepting chemotaxis protein